MDGRFIPPPPSSPLHQGSEMARFGFCAAPSLTWEGVGKGGGGWGFAVPFIMSKIAIFKKDNFILCKIVSFESKTNYQHWSTRTNSAVWQVPYACAQPNHPGSGSHGQLFPPYCGYPVGSHACSSSCFFFFCRFIFVQKLAIFEAYLMNPLRFSKVWISHFTSQVRPVIFRRKKKKT